MKKSRPTEAQIIAILKEGEASSKVKSICVVMGFQISPITTGNLSMVHAGFRSETDERYGAQLSRFKRMYADMALENRVLRDLTEKSFNAVPET